MQAQLGWTKAQLAELRPAWLLYKDRIESARRQAALKMDALRGATGTGSSSLAAMGGMPDSPLGPLMAAYTGLVASVSTCDAWMRLEMFAYVQLTVAFYTVCGPPSRPWPAANPGWRADSARGPCRVRDPEASWLLPLLRRR